jgi:peptide/nickel transport system ATP-binding protein
VTAAHLVEAVGLRRRYRARGLGSKGPEVAAVDGVDLVVDRGEAVGVVGGSGAGKSTLVRLLLALEDPDEGVVRYDGHEISARPERRVRELRRRFQPVFQDSLAALDPRMRVEDAVAEPLAALGIGSPAQRRRTVVDLLCQVGLPADVLRRYPSALSGGERQRVAIARALAPDPELLILDEPVSSLDATVALQVIDLLRELQRRRELTMVLVTHDVQVVREVCDRVVVMRAGKIVEEGRVGTVFANPEHDYTRQLLAALPTLTL